VVLTKTASDPVWSEKSSVSLLALADRIGDMRAGNMVMLRAMVEATGLLDGEWVASALARLVKSERWLDLERRAIGSGREVVHGKFSK
jgi:hypothetical protein